MTMYSLNGSSIIISSSTSSSRRSSNFTLEFKRQFFYAQPYKCPTCTLT